MHKKIMVTLLVAIATLTSHTGSTNHVTEVSATITNKPEKTWPTYLKKTTKSIVRCASGLTLIASGSVALANSLKRVHMPVGLRKNPHLSIQKKTKYIELITRHHRIKSVANAIIGVYMIKKGFDWINKKFKWRDIIKVMGVSMVTSIAGILYVSEYTRVANKIILTKQK